LTAQLPAVEQYASAVQSPPLLQVVAHAPSRHTKGAHD